MLQEQKTRKIVGSQGEQAVVNYLIKQGYTICARNYAIRAGEIDIIARNGETLAFVEVKTRTTAYFNLSEVIVPAKQRKIMYTARHYIFMNKIEDMVYRFDVALLHSKENIATEPATWDITYIRDAFTDMETLL